MNLRDKIQFRPYASTDYEGCLAVFDGNCPEFFAPCERPGFERYLTLEKYPYFVVTSGNTLLACGGYIIECGIGELTWGMVEHSLHGQGLGTFLFDQRLTAIRHAGASVLIMDTSQKSLGFYLRYGFVLESEVLDGYGLGLHRYNLRLQLQ